MSIQEKIMDIAVERFKTEARNAAGWGEFWANLLNLAGGNVESIVSVFRYSGVSETNIPKAFQQMRNL